jgi:hypothetical protein
MHYSLWLLCLHTNTERKYLKSLIEHDDDVVSITTLTYQL